MFLRRTEAALWVGACASLWSVLAAAQTAVPVSPTKTIVQRVAEVASGFCIDMVSGTVKQPPFVGKESAAFFARYGLTEGISPSAMAEINPPGSVLLSRATLVSGSAIDGAFAVALGGAAGETCRIIVHKAPASGAAVEQTYQALQAAPYVWKSVPSPTQPQVATKFSLIRRAAGGRPFLANLLAPKQTGPVAMVLTVAAIPANVILPKGY